MLGGKVGEATSEQTAKKDQGEKGIGGEKRVTFQGPGGAQDWPGRAPCLSLPGPRTTKCVLPSDTPGNLLVSAGVMGADRIMPQAAGHPTLQKEGPKCEHLLLKPFSSSVSEFCSE